MNQFLVGSARLCLLVAIASTPINESVWAADPPRPTRAAFLGEVLDPKPTQVTPKFDDYTEGSYHIDKQDLLTGLTDEAKKRKLTLRGVLIVGPMPGDPLWTSYVTVFLQDGEKVRVNSLVMPHARITRKATGEISADRYKKWQGGMVETGIPQKEPPAKARPKKDGPLDDWGYHILLAVCDAGGKERQVYYGQLDGEKIKGKAFEKQYNTVLKGLKKTYPEQEE